MKATHKVFFFFYIHRYTTCIGSFQEQCHQGLSEQDQVTSNFLGINLTSSQAVVGLYVLFVLFVLLLIMVIALFISNFRKHQKSSKKYDQYLEEGKMLQQTI